MEKNKLNILLISDIHNTAENIDKLRAFQKKNKRKYDCIFVLGDFDSMYTSEMNDEALVLESIESTRQMITLIQTICKNVFYLGGNHDPYYFYEDKPSLTPGSVNINKKSFKIGENLYILGFGGTSPTVISKNEHNFHTYKIDDYSNLHKEAFPYVANDSNGNPDFFKSNDLMEKELLKFVEKEKNIIENNQVIFLSHQGFFNSATAISSKNSECSYSGSIAIQKVINSLKKNVFMCVHGHTHRGAGTCIINDIIHVNPGDLRHRNFGEIRLIRDGERWSVEELFFKKLAEDSNDIGNLF